MSNGNRETCIAREKRAWTVTINRFADKARAYGYTVTPLTDGQWRIEKDGVSVRLASDGDLYLYLVDEKVVTVNRLHPRPGV